MTEYKDDLTDVETVELPREKVAEMARQQVCLDGEINILGPEGCEDDFDKWDVIKEAQVQDVRWENGGLHCWFEDEVRLQEKIARKTHWQPAEYKNHYVPVYLSIVWDMDPESQVFADIEVESP